MFCIVLLLVDELDLKTKVVGVSLGLESAHFGVVAEVEQTTLSSPEPFHMVVL